MNQESGFSAAGSNVRILQNRTLVVQIYVPYQVKNLNTKHTNRITKHFAVCKGRNMPTFMDGAKKLLELWVFIAYCIYKIMYFKTTVYTVQFYNTEKTALSDGTHKLSDCISRTFCS